MINAGNILLPTNDDFSKFYNNEVIEILKIIGSDKEWWKVVKEMWMIIVIALNIACIIKQAIIINELEEELHQAKIDAINEINKLRKED